MLELWDKHNNHYKTYETDDITIDGMTLEEHDAKVRADTIDECFAIMKEHSNPLWHDWLDNISKQLKEKKND